MGFDLRDAQEQFRKLQADNHAYTHALNMLYYDSVTAAPRDTAEGRGRTMAVLTEAQYQLTAGAGTAALVDALLAHRDELDPLTQRELSEFNREREYVASIPQDEYVAYTVLLNEAENVWHRAKPANDFAAFAPYLEKIVAANRRFAGYYRPDLAPYDVQLDRYERGLNMAQADAFFAALRERIVPLLGRVMAAEQVDSGFLSGKVFPVPQQRQLSDHLMQVLGLDRSHCALGETEHPFTLEFNNKDVRITTHYLEDDFLSSMFSVIHEGGHALYELGVGDELTDTCLANGVSMGIHESQSRLFENLIARRRSFLNLLQPKLLELFPAQLSGVSAEQLYRAVNRVQPSLIRTEADELTYSLHVMVRYELEKALMDGSLAVADLPAAWNAKYREYLGVEVPDDRRGVLQDSHWSGGDIGYFPSYALGSAYGAQILARLEQDVDVDAAIAAGDLSPIVAWLTERIYRHGCRYDPMDLLQRCCGAPFDPSYYVAHLETRFTEIYGL